MSNDRAKTVKTLGELVSHQAEQRANDVAYRFLVDGEVDGKVREVSFRQLESRARAVAAWLQQHDAAGQRAILLYPPGAEFIEAYFGCLMAGVVAVPAFPPSSAQAARDVRLRAIASNAGARLLLSSRSNASAVESVAAQAPELGSLTRGITDEIPEELGSTWRAPVLDSNSIAFLQYTSGSTSLPKGVVVSHGNLLANAASMARALGYCLPRSPSWHGDLVSWLPLEHDMGLIGTVILGLWAGRASTLMSPMHFLRKPLRWMRAISRFRARTSGAPNFAYDLCVRSATAAALEGLDLSSWEVAFNGSEPVRWDTMRRFAEAFAPCGFRLEAFGPCYGLAEGTLMVTGAFDLEPPRAIDVHSDPPPGAPGAAPNLRSVVSCGRAGEGTSVKIVDAERRVECPEGEIGEVWVSGSSVAQGYWNDPETSAEVFAATLRTGGEQERSGGDKGRYLRTGDLGFTKDGRLYITGRLKDLLIVDGRNIYPQDIEWTVEEAHPAVRASCVAAFSIEDPAASAGEVAVVVAEARVRADDQLDDVRDAIRRAVSQAHGLALHAVVLVRSHTIFKTSSGKIQRSACRRALLQGELQLLPDAGKRGSIAAEPQVGPVAPPLPYREGTRSWLIHAISSRARLDPAQVDVDRPLTEMGLSSRALVELTGELADWLGRDLPATVLFEHPTITRLLRHLDGEPLAREGRRTSRKSTGRDERDEPIAIVAMACRFPGDVDSPEALWRLLSAGRDAVEDFPADRWDVDALYDADPEIAGKTYARAGGFVRGIDRFDPGFFGIAPREAASMDPQQRLLLQTSWEALERAAILPAALDESETGVYFGMFESGYLASASLEQLDGYVGTGSAASVASGRVAYALGLHGPALTVDTACSSSLVALHLACQALRADECSVALAGGVTLMPTPRSFVEFSRLRGLSPSGRCKSFSEEADGVAWAEGCGVLVLKRLGDARRERNQILAVIRGTAVNQDGRSQGLTAPSSAAQAQVIRRALELSDLTPADIDYVEAHGTGTKLGDPIEARALIDVFGTTRPAERPLYLGSLKSNIAHAQAAAGVGGLIKVVLSLVHRELPRTLHADKPTSAVDWVRSGLALLTEGRVWDPGDRVRRAGVSSFGISGTNAHVIVEEAPTPTSPPRLEMPQADPAGLPGAAAFFPVSGRTDRALQAQAARLRAHLESEPSLALGDVAKTLAVARTHFQRRAGIVARDREELLSALGCLERGEASPRVVLPSPRTLTSGRLAFVFPGQGSQWVGMGAQLFAQSHAFAAAVERCDAALRPHTGWSVLSLLRGDPLGRDFDQIDVIQPALFSIMVALAESWRSLGVEPEAVVGHSQGEVAAACVAGILTLEDAARIVAVRSRALRQVVGQGAMAAIELPMSEVERRLAPWSGRLAVAAQNGPRATVVSGNPEALNAFLSTLSSDEVFARKIRVDVASHSPQMERLRDEILAGLVGIEARTSPVPFYSTVLDQVAAGDVLSPEYWYRNLREPVRFASAVNRLLADGFRFFVEVSPHPILQLAIETTSEAAQVPVVTVGSLRREGDSTIDIGLSLAGLHVAGRALDWAKVTPAGERVPIPTYAFEQDRHWREQSESLDGPGLLRTGQMLLGAGLESADARRHTFVNRLSRRSLRWLSDHVVFGQVVLSGTTLLEICRAALAAACPLDTLDVADLVLVSPLVVPEQGYVHVQVEVSSDPSGEAELELHSRPAGENDGWTVHVSARGVRREVDEASQGRAEPSAPAWLAGAAECWSDERHDRLASKGVVHGPAFRGGRSAVRSSERTVLARVSLPGFLADEASQYGLHPALLDAVLQAAAIVVNGDEVMLPSAIERWSLRRTGSEASLCASR